MCADKTLKLSKVQERKACLLSDQQREQSALAALHILATAAHKPLLSSSSCMTHTAFALRLLQRNMNRFKQ